MAAGVDALNIISSSLPTISQGCVFPRPTDAEDHQLELLVQEGHLTQEPLPLEVNIPLGSTRGQATLRLRPSTQSTCKEIVI